MLLDKKPKASREDTIVALKRVIEGPHPHVAEGPLLVSDIPQDISDGVVMGIDEAGRGPVLGPMTYAAAFWKEGTKIPQGYNDSKQMTAEMRNKLFRATLESREIGFVVRVLHATEISQNMLRRDPYNLNAMSHDTAMSMIRCVLEAGVVIQKCYIDTVGREDPYKARLDQAFAGRGIEFVVEKKADAKYVQCSAASVLAKVTRDRIIENWKFNEPHYEADIDFGSGYPSDPKCKAWLEYHLGDAIFCYPDLVRFSWGPAKDAMKEKGVKIEWEADEDDQDEELKQQQGAFKAFMSGESINKKPRLAYFESRNLKRLTKLSMK